MNPLSIRVNGREQVASVPARTHLGDFLREEAGLTGTHLGCEHGVCGACTVLLDGVPVRSCITFAVACEGREVTTVEGYDADPVMARLRDAFNLHHALQCGYCTPGMLATARDIVLRFPDADATKIRLELAGNLCRCTGYQGIVNAISDVTAQLKQRPDATIESLRDAIRQGTHIAPAATITSPLAAYEAAAAVGAAGSSSAHSVEPKPQSRGAANARSGEPGSAGKGTRIEDGFELNYPIEQVWQFMGDLPAVAACLPGASVQSHEGDRVTGKIAIKFGPMSAAFNGTARLERDDATRSAVLRGAGQDSVSQSRTTGDVSYQLESLDPARTAVSVSIVYSLQGPLAQFSRSGLVKDFVKRMIRDFSNNVDKRLGGLPIDNTESPASVSAGASLLAIIVDRFRRMLGR